MSAKYMVLADRCCKDMCVCVCVCAIRLYGLVLKD